MGMHGRKHSEETKRKIAAANRGKTRSAETRQKMSEAKKDKFLTLDWELAKKCATAHCTIEETAHAMAIQRSTLSEAIRREYSMDASAWMDAFKARGKAALKRAQFDLALAGNQAMLNWLGRQWLGQKEQVELEHTGNAVQVHVTLPDNQRAGGFAPDYSIERTGRDWGEDARAAEA